MRASVVALLGRILLSAIFIEAGVFKALAPVRTIATMRALDLPMPQAAFFVTVLVELLGGLAVLVGFRTRWAAALLCFWCFATAFTVHYHPGDTGQMINFMKNLAMAGGFLQLVAWGGGRFSIDRR